MNCYMCLCELDSKNQSEEHILLNAIGGRLASRGLLCKSCNSTFGNDIDTALASQLNIISNLLNIKRRRGTPPNLTAKSITNGEEIVLLSGGIPALKKPEIQTIRQDNGKRQIKIKARSMGEAKTILKGLQRKYPEIDIDDSLSKATSESYYLEEPILFKYEIGGAKSFRSLCKSAINFYLFKGGKRDNIAHLIPYLKGEIEVDCVYTYVGNHVISRSNNEIHHSIIIKSNNKDRLLVAYIELFNCYKFVVTLNDDYAGDDVNFAYIYDVLEQHQIEREIQFNPGRDNLGHCEYNEDSLEALKLEIYNVIKLIHDRQGNAHLMLLVEKATKAFLEKHPECSNEELSNNMISAYVNELMQNIRPWIAHNYKLKHKI